MAPTSHGLLGKCLSTVNNRRRWFYEGPKAHSRNIRNPCLKIRILHANGTRPRLRVCIINPRRACAARVTVLGLCVCLFVC